MQENDWRKSWYTGTFLTKEIEYREVTGLYEDDVTK